ncbi:ATP-binding protein, partial [bacterium]|nr:ATP-binding protein [bacterium]
ANFFNEIILKHDIDEIILETLRYLNQVVDSRVASLWIPSEDGFGKAEDTQRVVLKSVLIGDPDNQTEEDQKLQAELEKEFWISKIEDAYIGQFLREVDRVKDICYVPDITKRRNNWDSLNTEIRTNQLIAVPILTSSIDATEEVPIHRKVLGIICLRPREDDFIFDNSLKQFLGRLAQYISIVLERARLRLRYGRIDKLRKGLTKLPLEIDTFYMKLAELVKEVIGTEVCSIFSLDAKRKALILQATTAKNARYTNAEGVEETVPTNTLVAATREEGTCIFPLDQPCIAVETHKHNTTTLINDVQKYTHGSSPFIEETSSGSQKSIIAVPLFKSDGEQIGVLQCINKVEHHHTLLPVFTLSDKELMDFIAGIVSRFIEQAELNNKRRQFLNHLAHEFSTPLHALMSQINFVEKIFKGRQKVKNVQENFNYLREETEFLDYLVKNVQFQFNEDASAREQYDFKPISLFYIIEKVQKLLKAEAKDDKGINIRIGKGEMPTLYLDEMRFQQVIFNLLQNAVKYSRYGYHAIQIIYGTTQDAFDDTPNKHWEYIDIKNWGIGVLDAENDTIFQAYRRGSNAMQTATSGTGIGLTLSKRIIENHDGKLLLHESLHSSGKSPSVTTFRILLPSYLTKREPNS